VTGGTRASLSQKIGWWVLGHWLYRCSTSGQDSSA